MEETASAVQSEFTLTAILAAVLVAKYVDDNTDADVIDINMGCPVPKVIKTGAGSALMKDPILAGKIMQTVRQEAEKYGKAATVKTRIGFNDNMRNGPEFARALCDSGAQAICVHGRTASQMYRGNADMMSYNMLKKKKNKKDLKRLNTSQRKPRTTAKKPTRIK